jgi:hypothetical protein
VIPLKTHVSCLYALLAFTTETWRANHDSSTLTTINDQQNFSHQDSYLIQSCRLNQYLRFLLAQVELRPKSHLRQTAVAHWVAAFLRSLLVPRTAASSAPFRRTATALPARLSMSQVLLPTSPPLRARMATSRFLIHLAGLPAS